MRKKQTYFQDAMAGELGELGDLLISKQLDYGPNAISRFGLEGVLIRMSDKLERLINLQQLKSDPEVEESIEDTLRDIAGYAVIGLMVQSGNYPLPIKQKGQD